MTKAEIVNEIREKMSNGATKATVRNVLDAFTEVITSSVSSGEEIRLHGLGVLKTVRRSERQGRNPATGKPITIPEKMVIRFKAAPALTKSAQDCL